MCFIFLCFPKRIILSWTLMLAVMLCCVDAWRMFPTTPLRGVGGPSLTNSFILRRPRVTMSSLDGSRSNEEIASSLLGRDNAVKQAYNTYQQEFFLDSEAIKERIYHHAVYVSGAGGIGKSTFAKHFPSLMRSITPAKDDTRGIAFRAALNHSVELYIDCNAEGDQFNDDIDPKLTPEERLDVRLLARAAKFNRGLKEMLKLNDNFEKQCEVLKNANWSHVSDVLHEARTKGDIFIPGIETTFEALAKDRRAQLGLNDNAIIPIIVVVDEHQLMYDEFYSECEGNYVDAIRTHKKFLYPLMTIQGGGSTSWCYENNIRVMPMLAGTNGNCLKGLAKPNFYSTLHIPLRGLTVEECTTLALRHNKSPIHPSWFEIYNKNSSALTPIGYIAKETMGNPRMFEAFLLYAASYLKTQATDELVKRATRDLRKQFGCTSYNNINVPRAFEAICTGIPLYTDEIEAIQQPLLHTVSIIVHPSTLGRPVRRDDDKYIVQMAPLQLSNVDDIPYSTKDILSDDYNSTKFEIAVGERVAMAINLRRFLCNLSSMKLSIEDLFGTNSTLIWPSKPSNTPYTIPCKDVMLHDKVSVKSGDAYWKNVDNTIAVILHSSSDTKAKTSTKPKSITKPDRPTTTLDNLVSGKYDDKGPVLHIGEDMHPWFDLTLWLKDPKHLWWIQVKGSDTGTHSSSPELIDELVKEETFRKHLNGIQQLVGNSTTDVSDVTHSIAYVVGRTLNSTQRANFEKMVSKVITEHNKQEGAFKIGNVVLVDDLSNFIPPIAHKFEYNSAPAELVSLTENHG